MYYLIIPALVLGDKAAGGGGGGVGLQDAHAKLRIYTWHVRTLHSSEAITHAYATMIIMRGGTQIGAKDFGAIYRH